MKNTIHKLIVTGLLISGFAFSTAQKIDAKAKDILEAVSANYKSKKNLYFKFNYGTGSRKVRHTETGIFYSTPSQYKLNVMGNEQIFDGKKIYNISKEDQEITIAKPNGSEKALSPINYLDEYKNGYTVTYAGKSGALDIIKMIPTKDNGIKNVALYINKSKKQITKVVQTSKANDVTAISVNQYKENQTLDASVFSFDKSKYKNYLITEL
jgi:outer membrane lipoprotein-sorting protein